MMLAVGSVADVSEVHGISYLRFEVCRLGWRGPWRWRQHVGPKYRKRTKEPGYRREKRRAWDNRERRYFCEDVHWEATVGSLHRPLLALPRVLYTHSASWRCSTPKGLIKVERGEKVSWYTSLSHRECALLAGLAFNPPSQPPPPRMPGGNPRSFWSQSTFHLPLSEEGRSWQKLAEQKLGFWTGRNGWTVG
jgi:hypothetical protein